MTAKTKSTPRKRAKKEAAPSVVPSVEPHNFTHTGTEVMILRRTGKDRLSKNGFKYPTGVGSVATSPDWNTDAECGGGLHGWPWGFGIGEGMDFDALNDVWMVFGAAPADVIGELDSGMKCKFRTGTLRYEGDMKGALDFLREGFAACCRAMATAPKGAAEKIAGYSSKQAASGDSSTQAASGNYSKQAASGDSSTQAASGDSSTQAASGNCSTQAASGDYSKQAASGYSSTQAASGYSSTQAASGYSSKQAASGNCSTQAASGDYSTQESTGKDCISAIANANGRAKTGERGCFALGYWTEETGWEFAVGKVGRDGIKAHTWYEVRNGKLAEVAP